jgi:hypothetical protein
VSCLWKSKKRKFYIEINTFFKTFEKLTAQLPMSYYYICLLKLINQTSPFSTRCAKESTKNRKPDEDPPDEKVNCKKWSARFWGSTDEKPINNLTDDQREPKILQEINKSWADKTGPLEGWYPEPPNLI